MTTNPPVGFRAARSVARKVVPSLPRFRRNLWLLLLTTFLVFVGIGTQAVILNLYLVDLGYQADFLGLFAFVNTVAIGVAALLAGQVSRRAGPRRILLVAVVTLGVSMGGLVVSTSPIPLLGLACLNGIALAHFFVPGAPFVMDNARPEQRSTAFAAYFASQALASAVGSLVGGLLPTFVGGAVGPMRGGYVWTLVVSGILAGAGVLPLIFADDVPEKESRTSLGPLSSTVPSRRQMRRDLVWMAIANAFVAAATGFAIPFLNVFFDERLGASTADIGVIFAIGSGAMVIASLLGPAVGRRFGAVSAVVACRALSAPIVITLAFAPGVAAGATLYVLRTLLFNLTWPIDNAFAMELVPPDFRSTLAALRSTSWNLGWSLASGLAGVMIVAFGFTSIFVASALFLVVGSVVYLLGFRDRQLEAPMRSPSATTSAET